MVLQALAGLILLGNGRIETSTASQQPSTTPGYPGKPTDNTPIQDLSLRNLLSVARRNGISIFELQPELPITHIELEAGFRALLEPMERDIR